MAAADCDELIDADVLVESPPVDCDPDVDAEVLDDSEGVADSLVAADTADSLLDSDGAVELLVESDAADSLVLCDIDSVVDSVADSLVGPVLPGARTALPSVARVFRWAAVTS